MLINDAIQQNYDSNSVVHMSVGQETFLGLKSEFGKLSGGMQRYYYGKSSVYANMETIALVTAWKWYIYVACKHNQI